MRTNTKPIGVSEYKLTHELPKQLKGKVPSSKELKQMLTMAIRNTSKDTKNESKSNE